MRTPTSQVRPVPVTKVAFRCSLNAFRSASATNKPILLPTISDRDNPSSYAIEKLVITIVPSLV
ncbi:MAG: hypothetical protein WCL11_28025, partial [Verrucomicrobiota bacterium]